MPCAIIEPRILFEYNDTLTWLETNAKYSFDIPWFMPSPGWQYLDQKLNQETEEQEFAYYPVTPFEDAMRLRCEARNTPLARGLLLLRMYADREIVAENGIHYYVRTFEHQIIGRQILYDREDTEWAFRATPESPVRKRLLDLIERVEKSIFVTLEWSPFRMYRECDYKLTEEAYDRWMASPNGTHWPRTDGAS